MARFRAGGDDDVLGRHAFGRRLVTFIALHPDVVAAIGFASQLAVAPQPGDFILAKQKLDAFGVFADNAVLARLHLGDINRHAFDFNAVVGKLVFDFLDVFGRFEQRFGRNAANIQTCATEGGLALRRLPLLHTRDRVTQLSGADRGDVSRRAAADHDHIKLFAHDVPLRVRAGCATDLPALP